MERCSVCGEQRRNGARFCTTCGNRFATEETTGSVAPDTVAEAPPDAAAADPTLAGWPAPPPDTASPWASPAADSDGWPAPPVAPATETEPEGLTWAEIAATAMTRPKRTTPPATQAPEAALVEEFDAIDAEAISAEAPESPENDVLRERARTLLAELREVVDGLVGVPPPFSREDLASELEIALTRPATLEGDALSDLRAAATAAQERPRDLDTLTALTAQADTILALLVGYERTTAGIERALDTVRESTPPGGG